MLARDLLSTIRIFRPIVVAVFLHESCHHSNKGLGESPIQASVKQRHKTLSLLGSTEVLRQTNLQPDPLVGNLEL
jgi:hypothetical protein